MRIFVQHIFILFLGVLCWGGFSSIALALPTHDHHSHPERVSPFDGKTKKIRLHCMLHGHSLSKPCPHHLFKKNPNSKQECAIAPDCGGSPFKNQSATVGFGAPFMVDSTFDFHVFLKAKALTYNLRIIF
jgi:hypothetical protein